MLSLYHAFSAAFASFSAVCVLSLGPYKRKAQRTRDLRKAERAAATTAAGAVLESLCCARRPAKLESLSSFAGRGR